MRIGEIFQRDGSFWMVDEVVAEGNKGFRWLKVTATWSELGPRPLWANEPRTFLMFRTTI